MWLASTMPGLTASRSCHRKPLPRFCCASFQRESPGFTVTTFNFARAAGTMGGVGFEGVSRTVGGREGMTSAGAEKKTFGRSKGERRNIGERKVELRGLLKFLRLLLLAETARDVTEGGVRRKRLRVDRFLGFLRRRSSQLIFLRLHLSAIFRRED